MPVVALALINDHNIDLRVDFMSLSSGWRVALRELRLGVVDRPSPNGGRQAASAASVVLDMCRKPNVLCRRQRCQRMMCGSVGLVPMAADGPGKAGI
jgi:hypothetical protein